MNITPGSLLQSLSSEEEDIFYKTLVLITAYNAQGAMGFIVNKSFHRTLNELTEFRQSPSFPLCDGGPVDREHLFFVHRRPDLIQGSTSVAGSTCLGGNFSRAVQLINKGLLSAQDIKIFIGYCGWDEGDLEAEIAAGEWLLKPYEATAVFS